MNWDMSEWSDSEKTSHIFAGLHSLRSLGKYVGKGRRFFRKKKYVQAYLMYVLANMEARFLEVVAQFPIEEAFWHQKGIETERAAGLCWEKLTRRERFKWIRPWWAKKGGIRDKSRSCKGNSRRFPGIDGKGEFCEDYVKGLLLKAKSKAEALQGEALDTNWEE